jgi:hypothetical protein
MSEGERRSARMDHVVDRVSDRTGEQERQQRLLGGTAAQIVGGLHALTISLRRDPQTSL